MAFSSATSLVPKYVITSATEPSNPFIGQLWYDTENSVLKTYNGSSFVQVNISVDDVTLELNESQQVQLKDGGITNDKVATGELLQSYTEILVDDSSESSGSGSTYVKVTDWTGLDNYNEFVKVVAWRTVTGDNRFKVVWNYEDETSEEVELTSGTTPALTQTTDYEYSLFNPSPRKKVTSIEVWQKNDQPNGGVEIRRREAYIL